MSLKDASLTSNNGHILYGIDDSPYRAASNTIDFTKFTVGASGADVVNVLGLNTGEYVVNAWLQINTPGNASTTVTLTDGRNAGAILAASASDAAALTMYKAAGAGLNTMGTAAQGAGFLTLTTAAAFALNTGKATVFAVIGKAFANSLLGAVVGP